MRDCYRSTEWEALFELRAHVLTRRLVDKYVEYARHALDRHTKRAKCAVPASAKSRYLP